MCFGAVWYVCVRVYTNSLYLIGIVNQGRQVYGAESIIKINTENETVALIRTFGRYMGWGEREDQSPSHPLQRGG